MGFHMRILLSWGIILISTLRFPPAKSIATTMNEIYYIMNFQIMIVTPTSSSSRQPRNAMFKGSSRLQDDVKVWSVERCYFETIQYNSSRNFKRFLKVIKCVSGQVSVVSFKYTNICIVCLCAVTGLSLLKCDITHGTIFNATKVVRKIDASVPCHFAFSHDFERK